MKPVEENMMTLAIKISLLFSGLFLLNGMLTGIWKYVRIMSRENHQVPVYVDISLLATGLSRKEVRRKRIVINATALGIFEARG